MPIENLQKIQSIFYRSGSAFYNKLSRTVLFFSKNVNGYLAQKCRQHSWLQQGSTISNGYKDILESHNISYTTHKWSILSY